MKTILYILGITCLLVSHACSHDQFEVDSTASSTTLGVAVSLDRMVGESAMRAKVIPEQGEEEVGSLYLYFFEESDSREGLFVDYIKVDGPLAMNSRYTVETAGTAINASNAYNVIAVANIDDNQYVSGKVEVWSEQWIGNNEEYFRDKALVELSEAADESDNSKAITSNKILMNGAAVKKATDTEIAVNLTRNVARFDIISSVKNEYDLVSASIWNAFSRSSVTGDAVLEYSKSQDTRVDRFYGIDNTENIEEGEDGTLGDIKGGLYTFENKVSSPTVDDQYTTCLIVGLKNRDTGKTGYYRVNMHPPGAPQNLKRNNVYKLNITSVIGDGAASESEAYTSTKSELIYVVNNWDLDDNGLIISDEHSILAVPVKTVRIGADGGDFSYTVTTFSSLTSPDPLAVKSQTYDPSTGSISASFSGSTLTIRAEELNGAQPINGIITVSFAGLEANINVVQSVLVDTHLDVTLEDTWVSRLGSLAGLASEYIYVDASDTWTAELFGEGFSFSSEVGGVPVTTLKSTSLMNPKFHVYTNTLNGGEERKAFILISLDSDPSNYISAVTIYQKATGAINVSPDAESIVFDGIGVITSHASATIFTVSGTGSNTIMSAVLEGEDKDKFTLDLPVGSSSAIMNVAAAGKNVSGVPYSASVRISDNSGTERVISLRQNSTVLTVTPNSLSAVAVTGGQSELITVSTGDASSKFTAAISTASASTGKILNNHAAYFVDERGDNLELSEATPIGTKFRVKFPKVYFPNREMNITATVMIEIEGSALTKTVTINQNALLSKGFKIHNAKKYTNGRDYPYGNLDSRYIDAYSEALRSLGYSWTSGDNSDDVTSSIPGGTTHVHFANFGVEDTYDWTVINNFRNNVDGVLMMCVQSNYVDALNSSNSPLHGYNIEYYSTESNALVSGITDTRIGKFLTTRGIRPIAAPGEVGEFYSDVIHTYAKSLPPTAVKIVEEESGDALMAIDIQNKMVYLGESQIFYNARNVPAGSLKENFMYNFISYMENAAKYGSHFTDLLREDLGLPELWSDVWGNNKWPETN